jgi:hypothetical protein
MDCKPAKFGIRELVNAWKDSSLKINSEYQRGATWKKTQKQGLVDSVFRRYPIPPVFLHKIVAPGLGGQGTTRYEVVDGQQRIRAFADFLSDQFVLLQPQDKQLRLPNSLRGKEAPWGGRQYSQLDKDQKAFLDGAKVDAFVIEKVENEDEVRDLFIRLQSGTALNRQQVRDAWPGNLGPFIESLAGKLGREPSLQLFGIVDRRSDRGDDDVDPFTTNRQVCAQLLTLFLARLRDPLTTQSIAADDLDNLYHSNTGFDPDGPTADRFKASLVAAAKVFEQVNRLAAESGRGKSKHKKLDVFAVFFVIQDLMSDPTFKLDKALITRVAEHVFGSDYIQKRGKSVSGPAIAEYYRDWRAGLPEKLGLHLDPQRLFSGPQKLEIYARDQGLCGLCKQSVADGDAEYDHFPTPHYLGGKTDTSNGRLVCAKCHPRGRPIADD